MQLYVHFSGKSKKIIVLLNNRIVSICLIYNLPVFSTDRVIRLCLIIIIIIIIYDKLKFSLFMTFIGIHDLMYDNKTEHLRTINVLERFNIYQEVFLGILYRLLPLKVRQYTCSNVL